MGSRLRSCTFICARARSLSFAGGRIRSLGVAFILGWSRSFLSVRICSWAVVTLTRCGGGGPLVGGGGGCSSWQLRGGGVGWLVATLYLVGVKKEAVRVLVPAYLGRARPRHRPRLPSTGCACWGLVTWRSSILLVVVVGDDGRCVSSCRRVAVCRQRPRCVAGASLFWMVVGWVASSMVVVGRKKRRGNV